MEVTEIVLERTSYSLFHPLTIIVDQKRRTDLDLFANSFVIHFEPVNGHQALNQPQVKESWPNYSPDQLGDLLTQITLIHRIADERDSSWILVVNDDYLTTQTLESLEGHFEELVSLTERTKSELVVLSYEGPFKETALFTRGSTEHLDLRAYLMKASLAQRLIARKDQLVNNNVTSLLQAMSTQGYFNFLVCQPSLFFYQRTSVLYPNPPSKWVYPFIIAVIIILILAVVLGYVPFYFALGLGLGLIVMAYVFS